MRGRDPYPFHRITTPRLDAVETSVKYNRKSWRHRFLCWRSRFLRFIGK